MKKLALLAIGLSVTIANSVMADTPAMTAKSIKAIKPTELTRQEFLSYDEVTSEMIQTE